MTQPEPPTVLEIRPARSLSGEVRHAVGALFVCIAPFAYVFGFLAPSGFGMAVCAGLTLLLSTVQPKR